MERNWKLLHPDPKDIENICRVLHCHPVTAALLANRNIVSENDLFGFVEASMKQVRPPFTLKDADIAVRRIHDALLRNEKILIFGDYDVDGITSTIIMIEFLGHAGADVSYHIPHRTAEGYGLKPEHIETIAAPRGVKLVITVDCGSSSHEAVKAANRAGIEVIITDHHRISGALPEAVAVVNPKRSDCSAGFDHLAGVGVAYCLLICLRAYLREKNFWKVRPEPNLKRMCDLVALGTIADMAPLLYENRIFSRAGLEIIDAGARAGIRALARVCRIDHRRVAPHDIAFRLAPRINAPGRMDHPRTAVDLLTTADEKTADRLAQSLNAMNTRRQDMERGMVGKIHEVLAVNPRLLEKKAMVLSFDGWNEGVLGIVASRIVEEFFRPVVLLSVRGAVAKGSARSIPGFDLYQGLAACAAHIQQYGGHAMAAGLTVRVENMDEFRKSFEDVVSERTRPGDFVPVLWIDAELGLDSISDRLIDELESLEPFGEGNREPLFMTRNVRVLNSSIVGEKHRRMVLQQSGDNGARKFHAIQFNVDPGAPMKTPVDRMAYRLRWNRWSGTKQPQIIIESL